MIVNTCIRCGKQRVVLETWKEYVGNSLLMHTSTACPDHDCQKIVDKMLSDQEKKRRAQEREKEERAKFNMSEK